MATLKMQLPLLLCVALIVDVAAYSLTPTRAVVSAPVARRQAAVFMQVDDDSEPLQSEPSDIDVEAVVEPEPVVEPPTVEEPPAFADMPMDDMELDEGSIAKEALKAEVADGLSGPRPDKAVVGEILLALEAQNPTRSPATSPLLNGKWRFLYATGASPGLKALTQLLKLSKSAPKSPSGADVLDVQDTFLTISAEQPRAVSETKVRVLSFENTIKLASRLEAESAVRLVETYDAAESEYMNLRLPFQSPVEYKRSLLISYLDDEMLVVRDALGRPDVLMKIPEGSAWAPSSLDGNETNQADDAPGAS